MNQKRTLAPVFLAILMLVLGAGNASSRDSGSAESVQFEISGFDRVEVSHAFDVRIEQGDAFRVEVRVEERLREHLRVEKRGDRLVIGLKPGRIPSLSGAVLEADVRMPLLRGIEASGASDLYISGFSGLDDLEIDLSGASSLEGGISAMEVRIEASGASSLQLLGKASELRIDASGASTLDLGEFPARDADIELSGASEAEVSLSGILDIEASGASRLYFSGAPTMGRVDLSGASSIKRR